jgi:hypothetical protein
VAGITQSIPLIKELTGGVRFTAAVSDMQNRRSRNITNQQFYFFEVLTVVTDKFR